MNHTLRRILRLVPLMCVAAAGAMTHQVPQAQAWPVVSYDQFDGTYMVDGCSDPHATLNIAIGGAIGDLSDPLGLEPNEDGSDKPPLKIGVLPWIVPIPMQCVDGQPQVDLSDLGGWFEQRCTDLHLEDEVADMLDVTPDLACPSLGDMVDEWAARQAWHLSPQLESIDFDWYAHSLTWLFGNNGSNTQYVFADGNQVEIPQNLVRKKVDGQSGVRDDERATYGNLIDNGGYNETEQFNLSEGFGLPDTVGPEGEDLILTCTRGMLVHTHGSIDVSGDPGTTTAEMNLLPMANCAMEIADDHYVGFHVSVAMQYDFTASRV